MFRLMMSLLFLALLSGCMSPPPKSDDPYYAPVLPRTPMPVEQNNGAIYQPGFGMSLFDDRKAYRVGDIITITLNEKTQASKSANAQLQKDSNASIGLTSLFGGAVSATNPLTGNTMTLGAEYGAERDTKGSAKAGQSNSLTGSITVTVAEVLPNGILAVRGEKWMTLNTGEELVRIAGLIRSEDIGTDNTVPSTRVADARITYSGTGAFANTSQPGWLDRFFMSPLWPF